MLLELAAERLQVPVERPGDGRRAVVSDTTDPKKRVTYGAADARASGSSGTSSAQPALEAGVAFSVVGHDAHRAGTPWRR